jgi:hypothetical protein
MMSKKGPFEASADTNHISASTEHTYSNQDEIFLPIRRYDCTFYEKCLGIAATLDWKNFECRNCTGEVNTQLLWQVNSKFKDEPFKGMFLKSVTRRMALSVEDQKQKKA